MLRPLVIVSRRMPPRGPPCPTSSCAGPTSSCECFRLLPGVPWHVVHCSWGGLYVTATLPPRQCCLAVPCMASVGVRARMHRPSPSGDGFHPASGLMAAQPSSESSHRPFPAGTPPTSAPTPASPSSLCRGARPPPTPPAGSARPPPAALPACSVPPGELPGRGMGSVAGRAASSPGQVLHDAPSWQVYLHASQEGAAGIHVTCTCRPRVLPTLRRPSPYPNMVPGKVAGK